MDQQWILYSPDSSTCFHSHHVLCGPSTPQLIQTNFLKVFPELFILSYNFINVKGLISYSNIFASLFLLFILKNSDVMSLLMSRAFCLLQLSQGSFLCQLFCPMLVFFTPPIWPIKAFLALPVLDCDFLEGRFYTVFNSRYPVSSMQ